jgi:DNA primase
MSDIYSSVRKLPFAVLAPVLGIDLTRFKRRREEWQGYCPIHLSSGNNCFAYNDGGKYHCFACNAKGSGSIDFAMAIKKIGFKEACELLGQIQPPKDEKPVLVSPGASSEVLQPFKGSYDKYQVPCPWLEARIPDKAIRERYGVFCYENKARKSAYSGRVMIPIKSPEGVLYGYLGRAFEQQQTDSVPKYLFPKGLEKSKFLFGAHELDTFGQLPLRLIYLVESPLCVLKFASLSIPAVSPFGWSVSEEQATILRQLTRGCVYLPDRNKTNDCVSVLDILARVLWIKAPSLPEGIDDPENLSKEQILALH